MKVRLPNPENFSSDVKENVSEYSRVENKIEIETRITHQGEVNKARCMPQQDKFNIIATKTPSGEVHIFNYHRHPPKPSDTVPRPDMRLLGHTKEGYGLNWSQLKEGYLLSGSDDHKVCIWDTNVSASSLNPVKIFDEHKGVVEDVCWHKKHPDMFATCGDDRKLMLWDLKQDKPIHNIEAHSQEINSVEFNYFNEFSLITASNDKTIALWDIRNLSIKLHSFEHHRNDVLAARWNPNLESVFASYSSDRRVNVWDLNRLGKQQSLADAEDGPVELLVKNIFENF
jgi:histone-binding protein RBBP4